MHNNNPPPCTYVRTTVWAMDMNATILETHPAMRGTRAITPSQPPRPPHLHYHNPTVSHLLSTEKKRFKTHTENPSRATTPQSSTHIHEIPHVNTTPTGTTSAPKTRTRPTSYPRPSKRDLNDSALGTITYNMNHPPSQSTPSSQHIPRTLCNNSQQNKRRISTVHTTRILKDTHTLTNLNQ